VDEGPCHVYLTLPSKSDPGMIVTFQTKKIGQKAWVYYDTVSHNEEPISAYPFKIQAIFSDYFGLFEIHSYRSIIGIGFKYQ
jgi:hypothetical protein